MELKKNPKVDLRRYSGLFLEIGFVVALLAVLGAFSYTVHEKNTAGFGELEDVVAEEEIIPITRQQEVTPPPPPEVPKVAEVINIVDDDVEIDFGTQTTPQDKVAVIATLPLTHNECWQQFAVGEMAMLAQGEIIARQTPENPFYPDRETGLNMAQQAL